jgi:hypothetical protein
MSKGRFFQVKDFGFIINDNSKQDDQSLDHLR